MNTINLPVHAIAHARAGDKGDVSNISLIAYLDNEIVGRVAAIINWLEVKGQHINKMRFGWFDVDVNMKIDRPTICILVQFEICLLNIVFSFDFIMWLLRAHHGRNPEDVNTSETKTQHITIK